MKKGATFSIRVAGCKVNQYEARQLAAALMQVGLREAGADERADVVVLHSCAVTAAAAKSSRQMARSLVADNEGAQLLVTGCAPGASDFIVPVEGAICMPAGPGWLRRVGEELEMRGLADAAQLPGYADDLVLDEFSGHTRAFLKVQDGCNIGCSYCIVPSLRGGPRDRDPQTVLAEAIQLSEAGYREMVVTGVSVGLYGKYSDCGTLAHLLKQLNDLEQTQRLRMSSLHPSELTPELLDLWASSPKMLPHVHLPLQAGSNHVLSVMRRGYTAEAFMDAVARVRAALDRPAFTTDVICGFPGETEEDFLETMRIAEAVGFSQMHIFPYSVRPGTDAAKMKQVHSSVARERCKRLRELGNRLAEAYRAQFNGTVFDVLVEEKKNGRAHGRCDRYYPLDFDLDRDAVGELIQVRQLSAGAGMSGSASAKLEI